jgi:hypothetical protein
MGIFPPPEAQMGYLATGVIVAVVILILIAVVYVQHELRQMRAPAFIPSAFVQKVRRTRRVAPGEDCVCGGTIGRTGRISARFGELLGCTGCRRTWTADGRRIIRRRRSPRPEQPPAA